MTSFIESIPAGSCCGTYKRYGSFLTHSLSKQETDLMPQAGEGLIWIELTYHTQNNDEEFERRLRRIVNDIQNLRDLGSTFSGKCCHICYPSAPCYAGGNELEFCLHIYNWLARLNGHFILFSGLRVIRLMKNKKRHVLICLCLQGVRPRPFLSVGVHCCRAFAASRGDMRWTSVAEAQWRLACSNRMVAERVMLCRRTSHAELKAGMRFTENTHCPKWFWILNKLCHFSGY